MNENIRYAGISTLTVFFPKEFRPRKTIHQCCVLSDRNSRKEIAKREEVWDFFKGEYLKICPACKFKIETKLHKIEGFI